jgi:hypothetical protein
MEVHHHPEVEKKGLKEYLLEGLMIFLAVMMGYFAESLRENLTDNEKEKQAIESLVKCLASDTTQLRSIIQSNNLLTQNLDSLILLKNSDLTNEKNKRKFYEHGSVGFFQDWYFKTNDAAMQQIKSSGMLRLIKKQNVIDRIFGYELKNKVTVAQQEDAYFFFKESLTDYKKVADLANLRDTSIVKYSITNKFMSVYYKKVAQLPINGNKEELNTVFNNAALMAIALEGYVQYMKEQLAYGKNLILVLKKEYHLKDE